MTRKLVALTIALVFALPASSAAEFPWILWANTLTLQPGTVNTWSIVGAYQDFNGCIAGRRETVSRTLQLRPNWALFSLVKKTDGKPRGSRVASDIDLYPDSYLGEEAPDGTMLVGKPYRLVCLPATIQDPTVKGIVPSAVETQRRLG